MSPNKNQNLRTLRVLGRAKPRQFGGRYAD